METLATFSNPRISVCSVHIIISVRAMEAHYGLELKYKRRMCVKSSCGVMQVSRKLSSLLRGPIFLKTVMLRLGFSKDIHCSSLPALYGWENVTKPSINIVVSRKRVTFQFGRSIPLLSVIFLSD